MVDNLADQEFNQALLATESEGINAIEKAYLLIQIAIGLQQKPKSQQQLHNAAPITDSIASYQRALLHVHSRDNKIFTTKAITAGNSPVRIVCAWPYGLQIMGDAIAVADSGNNRVNLWKLAV